MPLVILFLVALGVILFVLVVSALVVAGFVATTAMVVISVVLLVALILTVLWFITDWHRLNLLFLGLPGATSVPAIPFRLVELPDTISKLAGRKAQVQQAASGLSMRYTIGGKDANAYTFMGMKEYDPLERALSPYTRLSLDDPSQYAMSWTTVGDVQSDAAQQWLGKFVDSLRDPNEATKQFWPTISTHGMPFNLLVLKRVGSEDDSFKKALGDDWTPKMESVWQAGNLYAIDMTFFSMFEANTVNFFTRFTPGTLTFLERDPSTKDLAPFAVRVSDSGGKTVQYEDGDPAWLYALQAAKTSVTVWGIWLGHVYHWHVVPAAMQMTMFKLLPPQHPVRQLFGRQSDYLIAFDLFLMLSWDFVTPPTSVTSTRQYIRMADAFAAGRLFFDDDPLSTLNRLGLRKEDFTDAEEWDRYPIARYYLKIFSATSAYVKDVVEAFYPDDGSVAADFALRAWVAASGDPTVGNVRGLPAMNTRDALKDVMTSLVYRITVHGAAHLRQSANPVLTFAPNFPPCLQDSTIPPKDTPFEFKTGAASDPRALSLSSFLPNTGTVGDLTKFLFAFAYSTPYTPFIPLEGIEHIDDGEHFVGPDSIRDVCDQALKNYRHAIQDFIDLWAKESKIPGAPAQIHQWDLNIAL